MQVIITYSGVVQGVGFRPTVYRLATQLGLRGCVYNDIHGVVVKLEGCNDEIMRFQRELPTLLPPIARIESQKCAEACFEHASCFEVLTSHSQIHSTHRAVIPADMRVCADCLEEMFNPADRRYMYPFINCTNCGPRYSITHSLPYDRCNTTMSSFTMCPDCAKEYHDPANRRYHAQPIACPVCGPHIELYDASRRLTSVHNQALTDMVDRLNEGHIVALKGIGGYQLICRADEPQVVSELRQRKHREAKPFAVMVSDIKQAQQIALINSIENELLQSHIAPIVLLKKKGAQILADNVCMDSSSVGIMLPTTPLHELIMQSITFPIVCTSANISDEPICIDDDEAFARLNGIADFFLTHNRPILRHLDDSVAYVVNGRVLWMRASRGVAPIAVDSGMWKSSMIGLGGHMKNTLTLVNQQQSICTQYLGDMDTVASRDAQQQELHRLTNIYPVSQPTVIADLHPDYYTPAEPQIRIQHHQAHIMSVALENNLPLPFVGFCWDATGYGHDQTIWGGECMEADTERTIRRAYFSSFPLMGGDKAAKQTWRPLVGMMHEIRLAGLPYLGFDSYSGVPESQISMVDRALDTVNPVRCCSVGRLFDAVGALLGIGPNNRFEGDVPMRVQLLAEAQGSYEQLPVNIIKHANSLSWDIEGHTTEIPVPSYEIDWKPMLSAMSQLVSHPSAEILALSFHRWLVACLLEIASHFSHNNMVLSGGCFQNRLLLKLTIDALQAINKNAILPISYPMNDGGVSLGQCAAVAYAANTAVKE